EVTIDDHMAALLAERKHARVVAVRGSIAPKGAGFAISIVAKDARSGATLVEQTLEAEDLAHVVPVVARLGAALRAALGEKLSDAERLRLPLSGDLEADHEFAVGLAMLDVNDIEGAIGHLERATTKDPGFAIARA